ncbi:12953_t:CDS:2, partial [Acaulospora colombiana]
VEGCTRGIYMWDTPFIHEGKRVIVLDCEGIDDPKQDQAWAVKLFIICLIVSSTFIYNINGIVGRDDIGKLYLMTDLSKFIQPPADCDFLPRLVVLLRDFQLDEPEDFKKYFFDKLSNVNEEIAKAIEDYFEDFNVFGRSQLRNLDNVSTEDLDEEFITEVTKVVQSIYSNVNPKYIGSSTMTGISLGKFLVNCIEKMNDPENSQQLSIPSEYETIIQYMAIQATERSIEIYEAGMINDVKEENLPLLWDKFNEIHNHHLDQAQNEFFSKVIGSPKQIPEFTEELNVKIGKVREKYVKKNSEALYKYNLELAARLWKTHIKSRLNRENLFKSKNEFDEAEEAFKIEYRNQMKASPEAGTAFTDFLDNNYDQALETLIQLGTLKEEQAKALRELEEIQKENIKAQERVVSLQSEIEQSTLERKQQTEKLEQKMNNMIENIDKQRTENDELKKAIMEQQQKAFEHQMQITAEREKYMQEMMQKEREASAEREKLLTRLADRPSGDDGGCVML